MKNLLAAILICAILCGCAVNSISTKLNQAATARVGAPLFQATSRFSSIGEGLEQAIIYKGKTGSVITLGYREKFIAGLGAPTYARPAFSEDFQYDLAAGNLVTFRDYQVKIHSADNSSITFEMLQVPLQFMESAAAPEGDS